MKNYGTMISQKIKVKPVYAGKIKRKYPNVKNITMSKNPIFEVEEEKVQVSEKK